MKLGIKILISVAVIIVYVYIGHLFAYYVMYANYFPKSVTKKILVPVSPLVGNSPFNDETPDVRGQKGYSDFADYYQNDFSNRCILIAVWPTWIVVYVFAVLSWAAFGVHWVITGELLRWLGLLPLP